MKQTSNHWQPLRSGIVAAAMLLAAPAVALAQSDEDVTRAIARAAASVELLDRADAASDASASIQMARARLDEARAARDHRDQAEAINRAQEAELNAKVALAEIEQRSTERRAQQLDEAVGVLERELAS
jgi:hypothetical protein